MVAQQSDLWEATPPMPVAVVPEVVIPKPARKPRGSRQTQKRGAAIETDRADRILMIERDPSQTYYRLTGVMECGNICYFLLTVFDQGERSTQVVVDADKVYAPKLRCEECSIQDVTVAPVRLPEDREHSAPVIVLCGSCREEFWQEMTCE